MARWFVAGSSGAGGSLLAMIARRLGRSVILLEKGKHPRFVIGESSTPLANLLLEELAQRYDLPQIATLSKWGSWQRGHPEVACGLKRGFTFYHHDFGQPFQDDSRHQQQLLVAASPHNDIADTHWYRPDFDHFFVQEAERLGAVYRDEVQLRPPCWDRAEAILEGEHHGEPFACRARFVVDATGPRGFLHRAMGLPELELKHLPPTQALYSHFIGVHRLEDMGMHPADETPPYPVDDAALHHVFDGGWIWVLRFNNGITSAGVAATDALAQELDFAAGAPAWERLLQRLPTVQAQFIHAKTQFDFVHARRLAFDSAVVTGAVKGAQWALLPSAVGFIDPLLSTGFPLTLLGITRLAEAIAHHWNAPRFQDDLQRYAAITRNEILATEHLVAALYASMADFPLFTALSLLYFTAASFTETTRRLGRAQLAGSFLMHDHPIFGPNVTRCIERALQRPSGRERDELIAEIKRTIEPFDVAGLSDDTRRNWYPVKAQDLFDATHKLGVTHQEIEHLLSRCGFVLRND